MENTSVYKAIKEIADELCSEKQTFLRADLAEKLKPFGITVDTIKVSQLTYEAYLYYHQDAHILQAFVSNDSRSSLVDEYKMSHYLDNGAQEEALKLVETELNTTSSALDRVREEVELNLSVEVAKATSTMIDRLTGTKGAKDVKTQASALFNKYSQMVEAYRYAEDSVRGNIVDFTTLRTDIETTYREYAMKLIDVYGDQIKMVAPQLFDFNQVEWLDVDNMLKYVQLEFDKISDKCSALIGEIGDNFRNTLQKAVNTYKSTARINQTVGLALAGLEMINHYMSSQERTNKLRSDLTAFKASITHDATHIKGDMVRLLAIYKTLNDVVLPKASVYLRYASDMMASDFNAITESLYKDNNIKPLVDERQEVLMQLKQINTTINDHMQHLDIYTTLISDTENQLEAQKSSYQSAKQRKPSKPFFLKNIVTLGYANKSYYRNFAEWDAECSPLIRQYDNYQIDLKLDRDELEKHQKAVTELKTVHSQTMNRLNQLNVKIKAKINCSDEIKQHMLKHVRTLVGMLKLGREIMETQLDKKLIGVVTMQNYNETEKLSPEIEENLNTFTASLSEHLHANKTTAKALLDEIKEEEHEEKALPTNPKEEEKEQKPAYSKEHLEQVAAASETALQQGINLFDSAARLHLQQLNGKIAERAYNEAFRKLSEEFKGYLKATDDKSAYLRKVMQRVHLASNEEERKQALLLMSDLSGFTLSEKEFDEFLKGNRQIEL